MWVGGTLEGRPIRRSMKTKSWERAKELADQMERTGQTEIEAKEVPTIATAVNTYLDECTERGFSPITIYHHRRTLERFGAWAHRANYLLNELDADALRQMFMLHPEWESGTRMTYRIQLSAWFNYCKARGWISVNPIRELPKIKVRSEPTLPFVDDEFDRLLNTCDDPRLRALLLLLRWSGLRIGDALGLERTSIGQDGVLTLTTSKTGALVRLPLPDAVLTALTNLPVTGPRYFLEPDDTHSLAIQRYRRLLLAAGRRAGVANVHFHRFRDSFAVGLLLSGTGIDTVSRLLGHSDIKTTHRHYNAWVASRQAQADAAVRAAWR